LKASVAINTEVETEKYRTGTKRLWAAVIDGIVFTPLLLVDLWLHTSTSNASILFTWATFGALAPLVYSIVLHYKTGQTVGKWVIGIRVLDVTETRGLTLLQSLLRDGFYLLIAFAEIIYCSFLLIRTDNAEYVLDNLSNFADTSTLWWVLIELATMLTNHKRRAIHDFIAKSVVVRMKNNE
jgi:uncharacterized RDD family membrane protein YckC